MTRISVNILDDEEENCTSRIACTNTNWAGIVYKIPRSKLELCKTDTGLIAKHLKQAGIYFIRWKYRNSF